MITKGRKVKMIPRPSKKRDSSEQPPSVTEALPARFSWRPSASYHLPEKCTKTSHHRSAISCLFKAGAAYGDGEFDSAHFISFSGQATVIIYPRHVIKPESLIIMNDHCNQLTSYLPKSHTPLPEAQVWLVYMQFSDCKLWTKYE